MGLSYTYLLVAERRSSERLVRAVAEHLVPDDRRRLLAALSSGADQVMDRVERDEVEQQLFERAGGNALCLRFLFPPDERLTEYAKGEGSALRPVDDRVQIGCVWTTLRCGSRYALIEAGAATSDMSRLFEQSQSVRATFAGAARAAGALLAALDNEQDAFTSVWPHAGRFPLPDERESFEDERFELKTDAYCDELVASARRTFG